jgi:hypothetical protein
MRTEVRRGVQVGQFSTGGVGQFYSGANKLLDERKIYYVADWGKRKVRERRLRTSSLMVLKLYVHTAANGNLSIRCDDALRAAIAKGRYADGQSEPSVL